MVKQTSIAKWGHSLALRLPKSVALDARLDEGTPVDLRVEDGILTVRPARPRYTLSDLLGQRKSSRRQKEIEWGRTEGEEAW